MNNGLFGFFIGANVTINTQEFDRSGVWVKPPKAQLCFIEATGGGQAGAGSAGTAGTRTGGSAGVAYQIIIDPIYLQGTEYVEIGTGGVGVAATTQANGNNTTFAGLVWGGGTGGSSSGRSAYGAGTQASNWGQGGASGGSPGNNGKHGGFGAGGGGRGGAGAGAEGGKPRSFEFLAAASTPATGGGAASGSQVKPENDVDGFGEGASGGFGSAAGNPGRRGSGGGGVGSSAINTAGGNGGDGFLRVITYCWE